MPNPQIDLGIIEILKRLSPAYQGMNAFTGANRPQSPLPQTITPPIMGQSPQLPIPTQSLAGGKVTGTPSMGGTEIAQRDPTQPQQQSGLMSFLKALGLPLLSTGVGLAFPQALPGAAGFNTGYAEETSKQRTRQSEIDKELAKEERQRNEPTKPTFGQEQKMKAIKAGLKRREVIIGREFGEPSKYKVRSLDDAISAITDGGFDPALFADELKDYEEITIISPKGQVGTIPRHQLEDALKEGYRLK